MTDTHHIPSFEEPLEVVLIEGEVVITGPNGFCGSFTPAAAAESARRLAAAATRDTPPKSSG